MTMKDIISQALDSFSQEQLRNLQKSMNNIMTDELVETMKEIEKEFSSKTPSIVCNWNQSIQIDEMEPNTIYLDGSCRGFALREEINSISFDHHTNCIRSITHATCVQVMNAIKMGLNPSEFEQVIIDDIDADIVMSVWLLINPSQVQNPYVVETVNAIGLVDAHFDNAFELHPLHTIISPLWNVERTESMLKECLRCVDNHIEVPKAKLPTRERPRGLSYGFKRDGAFERIENTTFKEMYQDFDVVMMVNPLEKGHMVTIGKKSEFVMWFDLPKLLATCGQMELEEVKNKSTKTSKSATKLAKPSKNWGGSSTIGGSARYADQSQGTRLSIESIIKVIVDAILS